MRTRPEIIGWRSHAAWATDAQIEQDLLLTHAMIAIFQDEFLSGQVAMRGGTVLHKVHLAPAERYSEDIDLVLVGERPIAHVEKGLIRVLTPLLGRPADRLITQVQLAVRNLTQKSQISRLVYKYAATMPPPSEMKVKIEINFSERTPCYPITHLPYQPPLPSLISPVVLRSYHLDEMLGTKMRALLQRSQGRDLFDLGRACQKLGENAALFDPGRVAAAFDTYMRQEGSVITRGEFEASLAAKCRLPAFRSDMDRVLPRGMAFDVDVAAKLVSSVLLARLH
jgi:predicted nucleotidyltransferase component of viral defense system